MCHAAVAQFSTLCFLPFQHQVLNVTYLKMINMFMRRKLMGKTSKLNKLPRVGVEASFPCFYPFSTRVIDKTTKHLATPREKFSSSFLLSPIHTIKLDYELHLEIEVTR